MRKKILLLFLWIAGFVSAQSLNDRVEDIRQLAISLDPADTAMHDLNPLHARIGNARVVMLADAFEGSEQTAQARLRMLKFLHSELHFDVVLMDLPVYAMQQSMQIPDSLSWEKLNRPSCWNKAAVYGDLRKYFLDHRTDLTLAGYDAEIPDVKKFPAYRSSVLGWADSVGLVQEPGRRDTFVNTFDFFLGKRSLAPVYEELKVYMHTLDDLQKKFRNAVQRNPGDKISAWRLIVIQSLQSMSDFHFYSSGHSAVSDSSLFDRPMVQNGSNVLAMMQHLYPGKKIVIWCSERELVRSWNPSASSGHITIADMLSASRTNELYTILFSGGDGKSATESKPFVFKRRLKSKNDLAAVFMRTKISSFYFDMQKAPSWMKQKTRGTFTTQPVDTDWTKRYNAIVFSQKLSSVRHLDTETKNP